MNPFDGYPYLVARIGRTQLRHITLLPADWPRFGVPGRAILCPMERA